MSAAPEAIRARSQKLSALSLSAPPRRQHRVGGVIVFAFDVGALIGGIAIAGALTYSTAWAYFAVTLVILLGSHAYRSRLTIRALDETPRLLGRTAIALVVLAPWAAVGDVPRAAFVGAIFGAGLLIVGRMCSYALLRSLRRRGRLQEPAVILGAGTVGVELARVFVEYPEYGITPIGFLDSVPDEPPLPLLGDLGDLHQLLRERLVTHLIVAFGPARESAMVGVLRDAVQYDVEVHIVPRFFDCGVAPEGPDTDDVRGIPLYRVRRAAFRARAWTVKRFVDVMVAGTALVLLSPVLLACAAAVRLSSPGPILFRQKRVGQGGKPIELLKFRTMRVNDDSDTTWSVTNDDRITGVGQLLRRTSLDELPQLWSILRGDMSLVGPRPERPYFVDLFSDTVQGYDDRHRLPVGLTGWAQINGLRGGEASITERSRFDNQYVEHWSPWRDFVIVVRTLLEVVRGSDSEKPPSR